REDAVENGGKKGSDRANTAPRSRKVLKEKSASTSHLLAQKFTAKNWAGSELLSDKEEEG
ncbi:MAG: hypothetical protein AAB855_03890, partial [Patescibacteria group bacterium]